MGIRLDYKRWSAEEEAKLERLLEQIPISKIAQKLGRSETSIRAKARQLHTSVRPTLNSYSMRYLADCLGVDLNAVRWWIKKGYLIATPNGVRRLSISAKSFANFCQFRPDIVNKFDRETLNWLAHNQLDFKENEACS